MDTAKVAEVPTTPETWSKSKKPSEYTLAEYEALSPQEQDLFFLWFNSVEEFESWMASSK